MRRIFRVWGEVAGDADADERAVHGAVDERSAASVFSIESVVGEDDLLAGRSGLPIPSLQWHNVTDSAAGIWDVAGVTGNYVEMELRHRLPGSRAIVETKIEGIGCGREL